jgi:hypothetical protein
MPQLGLLVIRGGFQFQSRNLTLKQGGSSLSTVLLQLVRGQLERP